MCVFEGKSLEVESVCLSGRGEDFVCGAEGSKIKADQEFSIEKIKAVAPSFAVSVLE